jgi:Flp pilus assembly CpaF family ATPase
MTTLDAAAFRTPARDARRAPLPTGSGVEGLLAIVASGQVTDVTHTGAGAAWVKRAGRWERIPPLVGTDGELRTLIQDLARHASYGGDPTSGELSFSLDGEARVWAVLDWAQAPCLAVRVPDYSIRTMADLVRRGTLPPQAAAWLSQAVENGATTVLTGPIGSGKTTLARCLLDGISDNEAVTTLEDTYELGLHHRHPHTRALLTRPANVEGRGERTMADLARTALRSAADRVVVGEVRGGEAWWMLQAVQSARLGALCTLHADTAREGPAKLIQYVLAGPARITEEYAAQRVGEALRLAVFCHASYVGGEERFRVSSILEVTGSTGSMVSAAELWRMRTDGTLARTEAAMSQRLADQTGLER